VLIHDRGPLGDGEVTVHVPTKEFVTVIEQMCRELFKNEN